MTLHTAQLLALIRRLRFPRILGQRPCEQRRQHATHEAGKVPDGPRVVTAVGCEGVCAVADLVLRQKTQQELLDLHQLPIASAANTCRIDRMLFYHAAMHR